MKFCQPHWDELRAALKERGLDHLGAKSGKDAVSRLKEELEGTATRDTYDPLMSAHNMIVSNAIRCGGLYLLQGDYCPLCELDKNRPPGPPNGDTGTEWVKFAADEALQYCRENKLVPAVQ